MNKLYIFFFGVLLLAGCQKDNSDKSIEIWLTTLDKKSLLEKRDLQISAKEDFSPDATISIDPSKTYQEIDGFGYTLTGGSALHLNKMSAAARADLLQELFGTGSDEIGISYLRLSIGASDLDETPFSYNDLPEGKTDEDLENFSLHVILL